MSGIRLICYGNSFENLKISLQSNVIGTRRKYRFPKGDTIYFVLKDEKKWKVFAKAATNEATDLYPFDSNTNYYTFSITDVKYCKPFEINEVCLKTLGPYWGLKLQQPTRIDVGELISFFENSFCNIDVKEFNKIIATNI